MLILRGENGFICHHRNSNTLDASRSVYDIFSLQFSNGAYHIKGQNTNGSLVTTSPIILFAPPSLILILQVIVDYALFDCGFVNVLQGSTAGTGM